MAIARFQPWERDLTTRNFSDLLDDFFSEAVNKREGFLPGIDVSETDTQFEINVTLPGMKKDDINISLENNLLTVSGERKFKDEETDENKKYHRVESRYGKFERSLQLPDNIDSDSVDATYEDGVLHITVEKSEDKVRKQIEIK